MASRFTEHFEINEHWQFSQSEPSSPLASSASESFFSSSSETLNIQVSLLPSASANLYDYKLKSQTSVKSSDPPLIHSDSFSTVYSLRDSSNPKKSKLRRFLTTIQHSRKSNK
ncbi:hypothetical protein [Parasitella parasitica]|uniref:Uncharacterized protein n=1 Tax=Parasitella parasitica TaxID=35722 RepID=A0A0B7N7F5_9FUNG|nr:hypothetical protein [Parasitella parasitica]